MLADDAMFSVRHQGKVKSFQGQIGFVCLSLAGGLIFVTSTVRSAIDHTSDLHLDSSFHKKSMKLDNYVKINEWFDSSLGQSMVIQ